MRCQKVLATLLILTPSLAFAQTIDIEKCRPSSRIAVECPFVEGGSETFTKARLQDILSRADQNEIGQENLIVGPVDGYSMKLTKEHVAAFQAQQKAKSYNQSRALPSGSSAREQRQAARQAARDRAMEMTQRNVENSRARRATKQKIYQDQKAKQETLNQPSGKIPLVSDVNSAAIAIEEILRQDAKGWGGSMFYTANSVRDVKLIGMDGSDKSYSAKFTYNNDQQSEVVGTFSAGKFKCMGLSMEQPFVPCRFIAPTTASRLMVAVIGSNSEAAQKLRDAQPKSNAPSGSNCVIQYIGGKLACVAG